MKVAVVSNCQGESFALSISAMNSGFEPRFILSTRPIIAADERAMLAESEIIFAQRAVMEHIPKEFSDKCVLFPAIAFRGLHPDMSYARGVRKDGNAVETIHGPMSSYHSGIALLCYRTGLTIDQTMSFFNPFVYGKLGYFDAWDEARKDLLAEGEDAGIGLGELFLKWVSRGTFMYSFNHPDIGVMADVARAVLRKIGIPAVNTNIAQYATDPLRAMPIWPVYPEIGARRGIEGDTNFICLHSNLQMSLREFVTASFKVYDHFEFNTIEPLNFNLSDFQRRIAFSSDAPAPTRPSASNPYVGVPRVQFWKDSVASAMPDQLDPVVDSSFTITRDQKVSTAGSCFAQHIARTLAQSGFNYFVSEAAPPTLSEADAKSENYGVFSARYGNIYTVRQLIQLIDRVQGRFTPLDTAWRRRDGRLVDPFRPQISTAGFADEVELEASRQTHFAAVRELLAESDVFIFTLGLTEGWRSKLDGAVFPLAPGVAGGEMDPDRYEFVNFNHNEILADLHKAIDAIKSTSPDCRVILTVSPVPLIATYEPRHALVATTYSKAVLRATADEAARFYDHVDYFPSYEIITGNYNKGAYFEEDLRSVTEAGVRHVMGVFMTHYAEGAKATLIEKREQQPSVRKPPALFDIVCDEEAIANFGR